MPFATLRERADALRDGIEELLLEHGSPQDTASERASRAHLLEAEALVSQFCDAGATDAGIAILDKLKSALTRARNSIALSDAVTRADVGATESLSLLDEALSWTGELRERALDEIAAHPVDLPGGQMLGAAPNAFRASGGGPTIHTAPDVPSLDLIARAQRWDDPPVLVDDEEEAPRTKTEDPVVASLERIGRDTMEDLAILGGLRRVSDEERWGDSVDFEARLLANLDLLWSLDAPVHEDVPRLGVPRALFAYTNEWSLPDWGRAFALSFGLGCCDSEPALRWVLLAMRRSSPVVLGAYVHGLSLGSNPFIDRTVLGALRGEEPADLLVAFLEIAERRGLFEASAVAPLLSHPSSNVRVAALRACRSASAALALTLAERALAGEDEGVRLAAADELARRSKPAGIEAMRALLSKNPTAEVRRVALRALATLGNPKDEALILEHTKGQEDGSLWLSFFGKPSHIALVLDDLRDARAKAPNAAQRARTAERAFTRMTGIPWSATVDELAASAERAGLFEKQGRLRHGVPYGHAAVISELLDANTLQGDRRILLRELALLGEVEPIDLDGFFERQRTGLEFTPTQQARPQGAQAQLR